MTGVRKVTDDERRLFEQSFRETRPLATPVTPATIRKAKSAATPQSGINGRTAQRLARGELEPTARLDLHGFTEKSAHGALATFLRGAQLRGHRLVLVVTGKGAAGHDPHAPFDMELDRRARGILKTAVPRWLAEPGLAGLVADCRAAHRKHGGAGALYVYLRKTVP